MLNMPLLREVVWCLFGQVAMMNYKQFLPHNTEELIRNPTNLYCIKYTVIFNCSPIDMFMVHHRQLFPINIMNISAIRTSSI